MGKIIALFNQKGGVGKTTTGVNLCASLTRMGRRVLLVDTDPQGHSTSGMGVDKNGASPNVYDVLLNGVAPKLAIKSTKYGDVLPANKGLFGAGVALTGVERREYRLKDALEPLRGEYDYIFIDCPALLELLTLNALTAADSLLIPVQCEYLALEGLSDLMATVRMMKAQLNPGLEIEGILLTMYDGRTNLSPQVAAEVRRYFKDRVFKTVIPRNVRLSEAPSHKKPVTAYDIGSRGAKAYLDLAEELDSRRRRK